MPILGRDEPASEAATIIASLANIEAAVEIIDNAITGTEMQVDIITQPSVLLDSTIAALGDGLTYTGALAACVGHARLVGTVFTDHASTLHIDQSSDGVNWDYTSSFAIVANIGIAFSVEVVSTSCRMRVVNSAGAAQGTLRSFMRGRTI